MTLAELSELINSVAPIDGINSNGVIWFKSECTQEVKEAAQALMDTNLSNVSLGVPNA